MLQFTLVVKMSGLLLLTPHTSAAPGRPTHVLMPATVGSVSPHDAQIGYRARLGPECVAPAILKEGICYVDLAGWSLEIGATGNATGQASFPPGNLSDQGGPHVPAHLLGQSPGGSVKARVTLHAGTVDMGLGKLCPLAEWHFQGATIPLVNVLDWRIDDFGTDALSLVLRRLNPGSAERDSVIGPIRADATKKIELFLWHVPQQPQQNQIALGDTAHHFHAFYDMLGVPPVQRPTMPVFAGQLGPARCVWTETVRISRSKDPGTVSCMLIRADPQ